MIDNWIVMLLALAMLVLACSTVWRRRADDPITMSAADALDRSGKNTADLVRAAAELTAEQTDQTKLFLKILREEHEQNLKMHLAVQARLMEAHTQLQAEGTLRSTGLSAYLQDPDARVSQEVAAWARKLRCDPTTAIRAIVQAASSSDDKPE